MRSFSAHWRDTGRKARFFFIEAQVFAPILLCLFHFKIWTLSLCISVMLILGVLSYFKISLSVFIVLVREWLVGKDKRVKHK